MSTPCTLVPSQCPGENGGSLLTMMFPLVDGGQRDHQRQQEADGEQQDEDPGGHPEPERAAQPLRPQPAGIDEGRQRWRDGGRERCRQEMELPYRILGSSTA